MWQMVPSRCIPRFSTTDGLDRTPRATTPSMEFTLSSRALMCTEHHCQRFCEVRAFSRAPRQSVCGLRQLPKESNRQVENVYAIEKAGGFNGKGSAEAFDFTTHRLATGSQMLLNLWYTAWLDSATSTETAPVSAAVPSTK